MMTPSSIGSDWQNWEDFAVKRPDGGYFIAYATVTDDCTKKINDYKYAGCGYMLDQVWKDAKCVLQSNSIIVCIVTEKLVGGVTGMRTGRICIHSYLMIVTKIK